ncbi:hypothetical protein MMC17_010017 [Xylographa soralifera]|nr:hypothetical protein [Xylographa soralifera]
MAELKPRAVPSQFPQHGSPFMKIPQEIRFLIYGHLYVRPKPIKIVFMKGRPGSRRKRLDVAVLLTCRAILCEAYTVLYGRNYFKFPYLVDVFFRSSSRTHLVNPTLCKLCHIRKLELSFQYIYSPPFRREEHLEGWELAMRYGFSKSLKTDKSFQLAKHTRKLQNSWSSGCFKALRCLTLSFETWDFTAEDDLESNFKDIVALFGQIIGRILESLCLLGLDQRPAFKAQLAEVMLAKDDAVQRRHMPLLGVGPRAIPSA